jgi:S-adenosylmethionine hydrolase
VAAHLATGLAPARLGKRIEDYARLAFARPTRTGPKQWSGVVLKIDRFGNVITNFESEAWKRLARQPFEMRIGAHCASVLASNYAERNAGELFAIAGSAGFLEVSMNQANAAVEIGIQPGDTVELRLL